MEENNAGIEQQSVQQESKEQAVAAEKQEAIAKKRPARKRAQKKKVLIVKSKRKEAVARASIKPGSGRIFVNRFRIEMVEPQELRYVMMEPLLVSRLAGNLAKKVDIIVNVKGGGISAQAQAVRNVIAKSISAYAESDVIRKELMHYDRSMLVDDPRRVESKKFKGPKARARFQTSYR
ncbi:MAG: 30S ribosomal protein S9 [Candidatus Micrarchaeia archaeon]